MAPLKTWISGLIATAVAPKANTASLAAVATSGQAIDMRGTTYIKADFWTYAALNPLTNGLTVADSVTPAPGQYWMLANSGVNNGVWFVTASGAWTRHPDLNTDAQLRSTTIFARSGTGSALNIDGTFNCTNSTAITIGTTTITYSQVMTFDALGNVNYGLWGTGGNIGFQFYSAGGTTATASIQRQTGANGNFIINQTGTGSCLLTFAGTTGVTVTGGRMRVGSTSAPTAELHIGGAGRTQSAWGLAGIVMTAGATTYTDSSTAASGTVSAAAMSALPATTYAATNTSVTVTDLYGLYVNRPTTGANVTATRRWSLGLEGGIQANALAGNGVAPVLAAGAALGTTPNVGSTTGNNVSFSVTTTSGTATSTGVFFTGTFSTAYPLAPRAIITPSTANVAGLNLFVTTSTSGFTVSCGTAPAASTAYGIQIAFLG
ncbi:MAG: hypothetical protein RL077_361 [Verrucomicrobiota bacterium]|jgi:hypothetical protein